MSGSGRSAAEALVGGYRLGFGVAGALVLVGAAIGVRSLRPSAVAAVPFAATSG